MSSDPLRHALVDLGWSLFTELGVPGVVRKHQRFAIDPEPLVVAVPALFELDPRLRDQVYGWCATHASRLSVSRLQGLARQLPQPARHAFQGLVATLRAHARVRWPGAEDQPPWARPPEVRARDLPADRPALVRFRVRALCGVGARADVLCELLAQSDGWTRASELAELGYSKRSVAGIVAELSEAGLAHQRAAGNALTFRLADPESLRALIRSEGVAYPDWRRVMSLALACHELAKQRAQSPTTRRVEANNRREGLGELAVGLGLAPPPVTRGNPGAWDDLLAWATATVTDLAQGTSAALDP